MMRRKKLATEAPELYVTEGLYKGNLIVTALDPFFGYELAKSTALLEVMLVEKIIDNHNDHNTYYKASIIINQCTYFPEYLSYLFPQINIDTTAEISRNELSNEVTATGFFPFISDDKVTGPLKLTPEIDGSINIKSALMGFSIFAKFKKQAVAVADNITQNLPTEAVLKPF